MSWEKTLQSISAQIAEELASGLQNMTGVPIPDIISANLSLCIRVQTRVGSNITISSPETAIATDGKVRDLPDKNRYMMRPADWARIDKIQGLTTPQKRWINAYRENGNKPLSSQDASALLGGRNVFSQRKIINTALRTAGLSYRIQSPQAYRDMSEHKKTWMMYKHPYSEGKGRKIPYNVANATQTYDDDDIRRPAGGGRPPNTGDETDRGQEGGLAGRG